MKVKLGPAVLVTVAGVVPTVLICLGIYHLQAHGLSAAAISMASSMNMADMRKYWAFPILQASGLTGIAFAYVSVILGLMQMGGINRPSPAAYQRLNLYHRYVSLLVVALVVIHVIATVFDAMGDSWKTVLIPGQWVQNGWPEGAFGYNLGIIATYLLLLLGPTFYVRRLVGSARWYVLHRFAAVFYVLSFWHAMVLGLDVAYYGWLRPAMWLLQIPLLVLLMVRLQAVTFRPSSDRRMLVVAICGGLLVASAAAIVAILALVLTGHSGFIQNV